MKKLLLGAVLLVSAQADEIDRLGFLSGCWAFQSGPMTIEEQWNRPAGGMMLGTSRTLKAGKAVFHEFIRIDQKDGAVFYTPRVSATAKPISFKLVKLTDDEAVFENPEHDFPQRVIYRKAADGLPARIEGTVNGTLKGQDFPYKRVSCP